MADDVQNTESVLLCVCVSEEENQSGSCLSFQSCGCDVSIL